MKKTLLLLSLILLGICISACTKTKTLQEKEVQTHQQSYVYKGEMNVNSDNRKFVLEEAPENIMEETVANDFLYTITGDFNAKGNTLADIEVHKISIENEKQQFADGNYIQSYTIHEISTLKEDEYSKEELENGAYNPLCYPGWKERVEEFKLTEYAIVNVKFTQIHSEKSIEQIPQWGNGTFNRSFIVGKTVDDDIYKIYDFGMM